MRVADHFVHGERVNAALGWGLVSVVVGLALVLLVAGALLWGAFAVLIAVAIAVPAIATRDWQSMVPWPVVLLCTVAVLLRSLDLYAELAGYLAVAGLALVVVVEIDATSRVSMSRRFAVLFAVLTTMALQSWWTVAQFYSDRWFGTSYLSTQTELQWDLVLVTVVALVVGGLFQWYFERFEHVGSHRRPIIPDDT